MEERGRGSVARQKDVVNRGVQDSRGDMFAGGSNILMSKLTLAAEVSLIRSSEVRWGLRLCLDRLSGKPSTLRCPSSPERSRS